MAIKTASGSDLRNSLSSGLVLLNTTSFSGVSSQSINDVFSATYENYLLQINANSNGNNDLYFRFRASGSDKTTGYYRSNISMTYSSSTVNGGAGNNIGFHYIGSMFSNLDSLITIDVGTPQVATERSLISFTGYGQDKWVAGAGMQVDSESFTGFTIYPSAGTITGTVRVYGYNN